MDHFSIRAGWTEGDYCRIYSRSNRGWFRGRIEQILITGQGEWLHVRYAFGLVKAIQRYHPCIRPNRDFSYEDDDDYLKQFMQSCEKEISGIFAFICSLNIGDKIDVLDIIPSLKCWHISTILQIKHEDDLIKILVHYDGFGDRWNEWIIINRKDMVDFVSSGSRIKKLHTHTPYHHYLIDPSLKPCTWKKEYRSITCKSCLKQCCQKCFITRSDGPRCKLCMDKTEDTNLFKFVNSYSLFCNAYHIDINIIYLITSYSKGVISMCLNGVNPCDQHGISYLSKFHFKQKHDKKLPINGTNRCYLSFNHMDLHIHLLLGIHEHGWNRPSLIQKKAILPMILGHDIIVQSPSGTGKTGVFSIASLQRVDINNPLCQILILSPTRELSRQIYNVIFELSAYIDGLICGLCVDGTSVSYDTHIVVGTPQGVNELLSSGTLSLNSLELFILDEADEILSGRFKDQIDIIFQYLPNNVQYALFSATFPREVLQVASEFMRDPVKILVKNDELIWNNVKQYYIDVNEADKLLKLADLRVKLEDLDVKSSPKKAIIFVNTPEKASWLYDKLVFDHFAAGRVSCIHSATSEEDKESIMKDFRSGVIRVLISTDLPLRGTDLDNVSLMINYDLPIFKESYIHRIGRTGRCGRKGCVISFVTESDTERLRSFETIYHTEIHLLPDDLVNVDTITLPTIGRLKYKIMVKCPVPDGKQKFKGDVISIHDTKEINYDYGVLISDMMIDSKYMKRKKSKSIERNKYKRINNEKAYYQKKIDKRSNVKQKQRYHQRYGLIQY